MSSNTQSQHDVIISLKDELSSKMKTMEKSVSNFGKKSVESSQNFAKAFVTGTAVVGAGLAAYGKSAVEAYNTQVAAEAKLIQLHQENTGATVQQTQSLMKLASQIQENGVIGDEAIINGQAQLATFKMSTEAIASLTPAMADMVAQQKGVNATGEDFVNVGNLIGKVMEGQVGALGRYGVSFSDAQEKILKTGTETERAAALAEVLAQNYGGVNEALRGTFEGSMQAAKNSVGDFNEVIGGMIVDHLQPLVDKFNDWMSHMYGAGGTLDILGQKVTAATTWMREHQTIVIMVAGAIAGPLVLAFASWAISAAAAAASTLLALAPIMLVGAAIGLLYVAWKNNWGGIQDKTRDAMAKIVEFYHQYIVPFFQKIKEYADNMVKWWKENWDWISQIFSGVWQTIVGVFKISWALLSGAFKIAIDIFTGNWGKAWDDIKGVFVGVWNGIKDVFLGIWDIMKGSLAGSINFFIDQINRLIKNVNKLPGVDIKTIGHVNSFDVGTNYVPYDQLAIVHEGEAIIPKAYNPYAGNGGGGGGGSVTIQITGDNYFSGDADMEKLLAKIEEKLSRQQELAGWGIA